MSNTAIGAGDPKAIRRYSAALAIETMRMAYFGKKFTGTGMNNIIEEKKELEADQGDKIQFDLSVQLRNKPVHGDRRAKGQEEALRFYTDEVLIDQMRHPVDLGGRMTKKRTIHDLRGTAKARQSEYWANYDDQETFMYLSGARGTNEDFYEDEDFTGRAGNALQAPDGQHLMYAGSATSKATLTAADKMDRVTIEKAAVKAEMMRSKDPEAANMVPVSVEGGEHYIIVMSPFQEYDLRTDVGEKGWLDLQKAAAAAEGNKNKIFRGSLGMINNVVLHSHRNAIRWNDGGAAADLEMSRSLFMGRQAGVCAYGTPKGMRYQWEEEVEDFGNSVAICSGVISGKKKARFKGRDFGVISIDTAAVDPNA